MDTIMNANQVDLENCLLSSEQEEFFNIHGSENKVTKQRYSCASDYYKKQNPWAQSIRKL